MKSWLASQKLSLNGSTHSIIMPLPHQRWLVNPDKMQIKCLGPQDGFMTLYSSCSQRKPSTSLNPTPRKEVQHYPGLFGKRRQYVPCLDILLDPSYLLNCNVLWVGPKPMGQYRMLSCMLWHILCSLLSGSSKPQWPCWVTSLCNWWYCLLGPVAKGSPFGKAP